MPVRAAAIASAAVTVVFPTPPLPATMTTWEVAQKRSRSMVTDAFGGVRYGAFVAALAGEESAAAELEHMIDLADAGQGVTTIDAQQSGLGAQ